MTEAEWMECKEPNRMGEFAQATSSPRKARLFYCACCRHNWEHMEDEPGCRNAVLVAEAFADDKISANELTKAFQEADEAAFPYGYDPFNMTVEAARPDVRLSGWMFARTVNNDASDDLKWYCEALRCIYGPLPFRPVSITSAWLTPSVLYLAQAAYDNRSLPAGMLDNACLAVLADALEDASCDNADILNHCRQPGEHVRGCWVLDLLTGRQ